MPIKLAILAGFTVLHGKLVILMTLKNSQKISGGPVSCLSPFYLKESRRSDS